jgi:hypothetical protein
MRRPIQIFMTEALANQRPYDPWGADKPGRAVAEKRSGARAGAAKIAPASTEMVGALGWMTFQRHDQQAALSLFERGHNIISGDPSVSYRLAVVLDSTGKRADAKELLSATWRKVRISAVPMTRGKHSHSGSPRVDLIGVFILPRFLPLLDGFLIPPVGAGRRQTTILVVSTMRILQSHDPPRSLARREHSAESLRRRSCVRQRADARLDQGYAQGCSTGVRMTKAIAEIEQKTSRIADDGH